MLGIIIAMWCFLRFDALYLKYYLCHAHGKGEGSSGKEASTAGTCSLSWPASRQGTMSRMPEPLHHDKVEAAVAGGKWCPSTCVALPTHNCLRTGTARQGLGHGIMKFSNSAVAHVAAGRAQPALSARVLETKERLSINPVL